MPHAGGSASNPALQRKTPNKISAGTAPSQSEMTSGDLPAGGRGVHSERESPGVRWPPAGRGAGLRPPPRRARGAQNSSSRQRLQS